MAVNITTKDLQTFKEGLLEELVNILEQRKTTPGRKWLRTHDVMRFLQISYHSLQKAREEGLPYSRIGGVFYYDFDDIRRVLEQNKIRSRGGLLPGEEPFTKRRKS
jgi:hypothetical protein